MFTPEWVEVTSLFTLYHEQMALFGGQPGIRDHTLLESAVMAPQHLYHYSNPKPGLAQLAACYAHGITRNHPFTDGNKRMSLVACRLFLKLNGYTLDATQTEKEECFLALAQGALSQQALANWIDAHLKPLR